MKPTGLCQRIAIFKTRLITVDTPENLRKRLYGRKVVFHLKEVLPAWAEMVKGFDVTRDVQVVENKLVVRLDDPEEQNPLIIRSLVEAGAQIQFVGEMRHSLEDIYLQIDP